jgi:hypothetical protein
LSGKVTAMPVGAKPLPHRPAMAEMATDPGVEEQDSKRKYTQS